MTPDLTERMAKLLRLACCENAPDGERLAAISRLSATAAAHDVCWDAAFSGSGPSREQMRQLFDASAGSRTVGRRHNPSGRRSRIRKAMSGFRRS